MKAIVVTDQAAEAAGIKLAERPEPAPAINDVVVEVHASGFVPAEWEWPSTWVDRSGHDRAQAIIGHEFAGVVASLGYGTTGLSLGQRVFGITDWHRDGTLAEYAAVEARNLAPLPGAVDFTVGASLPISGLTAWQGLFQHGRLRAGQSVLAHGAAGAVGSMVTQLAREFGAYVIGTGRAADRQTALDFGANEFLALDEGDLEDVGGVDLVFDVIGGDVQRRSAGIIRPGGTLVALGIGRVGATFEVPVNELVQQQKRVVGSLYGSANPPLDLPRLWRLYGTGRLPLDSLLGAEYPLDSINEAYAALVEGAVGRAVVRP